MCHLLKKITYGLFWFALFYSADLRGQIRGIEEDSPVFANEIYTKPDVRDSSFFAKNLIRAGVGLEALGTTNDVVPFWFRSNRNGDMPLAGGSGNAAIFIRKDFDSNAPINNLTWSGGVDLRLYGGETFNARLIEGWLAARYSIFQLKAGRDRMITGLADTLLSSGSFSVSGNALGIPQVELSIPEFWNVPLTNEVIAIKGSMSHGWAGTNRVQLHFDGGFGDLQTFYHQKQFYMRVGKPSWKVKLYGGINHQAHWGSERAIFGPDFEINGVQTFTKVFFGQTYANKSVPGSKIGNHLGSIDQALEWDFPKVNVTGYHQFFYDIGGIYHLTNLKDGLWGLKFVNKSPGTGVFKWKRFLAEFLYSKSQGGEITSKPTPSGAENYYNNFRYPNGWTYRGENIGTPMFTAQKYIRRNLPQFDRLNFQNNRVIAAHIGAMFSVADWHATVLGTYSANYGTYYTAPVAKGQGGSIVENPPPYFSKVSQLSAMLSAERPIKIQGHDFSAGFRAGFDYGELLYNSVAFGLHIRKSIF